MSQPGDKLGERYCIEEVLTGGMGEVCVCTRSSEGDETSGGRFALKTFQQRFFFDNAVRESFVREAMTWLRLSGTPHVLPVFTIEHIDNKPYLLMPAVPRGPSGERSVADLLQSGPLDVDTVLVYAVQIALALAMARDKIDGLVHGDLKPANVLLMNDSAFLADFGLASAANLGRADTRLQGSWAYRAPELWSGPAIPTVATDIYSFGTMVYEMLVGRTPHADHGGDYDIWAAAHCRGVVEPPPGWRDDGTDGELMTLALRCLARNAHIRPRDFHEVNNLIAPIFESHDPVAQLMVLKQASDMRHFMAGFTPALRTDRISSLLEMGEPHAALEDLDAIDTGDYDAVLWLRRGTALSLLNRDEEALRCYDQAENLGLPSSNVVDCDIERALSLKRLGRFAAARDKLAALLATVSDDKWPNVVINLSTVYLAQQAGEEAVHLLLPFVRRMPKNPTAWANLGMAYMLVGRFEDAEAALGKSLALAPHYGKVRVALARLYMDHLGRIEEAWHALDAAFDSGHESREWLVRALVCAMLLNHEQLKGFVYALNNNFDPEVADSIRAEAKAKLEQLVQQYRAAEKRGETVLAPERPEPASRSEPAASTDSGRKPRAPFLNFRSYDGYDFTMDFYQPADTPGYVDTFVKAWQYEQRDPRMDRLGTLRGAPFYFSICPSCSMHVLTNRDVGKEIRCRMCDSRWHTQPIHGGVLDEIVTQVADAMGVTDAASERVIHALIVKTPEPDDEPIVRKVCERAGMTELASDQLLAIQLHQDLVQCGASITAPWTAWQLEELVTAAWARDATPKAISEIVRELRFCVPAAQSVSKTISAKEAEAARESIHTLVQEQEEAQRAAIREGRANAVDYRRLAETLLAREEWDEAEQMARAAIALQHDSDECWETLGLTLFKRGDYAGAVDALMSAVKQDPTAIVALRFAAICYSRLGDEKRARELEMRAQGMTGGEIKL